MNFTVAELAEATGALLLAGDPTARVGAINTDTRTLREGETFLAIAGRNFNGDAFLAEALRRKAGGIIASQDPGSIELPPGCFFLQVPHTTVALGDIAREWRKVVDPTVVAITGSAGKTTVKEISSHLCRRRLNLLATEGNFNNLIGLPLTLLRLRESHELAIVEAGMNQPGELDSLARIALPDISVITNIGNAHIGNFGTQEGLIRAKAELFEAMPRSGTAIINADCPHSAIMAEAFDIPEMVLSYGQNEKADVRASNIRLLEPYGYEFNLRILEVEKTARLHVYGRYQVMNALAATTVAVSLGIDPEEIIERLGQFEAPAMRSQTEWIDGMLVITDCYNASPDAMVTSVRSLADVAGLERRVALLGDMYELGDHTEKFHRQVGRAVAEAQMDLLVTVGSHSRYLCEEAERRGVEARHFSVHGDAAEFLARELQPGDGLIVKGSRGMKLETVLQRLKELRSEIATGARISETTLAKD